MLKFAVSAPLECSSSAETGTCPPPEGSPANASNTNSDYGGDHHCAVCESRRRTVVIEKTRAARRSRSRSKERKKQSLPDDEQTGQVSPPVRRRRRSLSRERQRNSVKLKFIENNDPRKIINIHIRKPDPVFVQRTVSSDSNNRDVDSLYSNCSESGVDDRSSCFADSETSSLTSYDELIYAEFNRRGRQRVRFCEESIIRSELHDYKTSQIIKTAPPAYDHRLQDNRTFEMCQRLNDVTLSADDEAEDDKENDELVLPIFIKYPVKSSERTVLKSDDSIDPIDADISIDTTIYDDTTLSTKQTGAIGNHEGSPRPTVPAERTSTDAKDIEELVMKSCFGNQRYLEMVTSDYETESVSSGDSISTSKRRNRQNVRKAVADNVVGFADGSRKNSINETDIEPCETTRRPSTAEFDLYNLTTKTTVLYPHKALSSGELSVQTGEVVYVDPREIYSKRFWVIAYMVSTGECGFIPKVNLATRKMENIV